MAIPIVNSRDLPNTWRILDDKLGNFRDRGLPFKYPYVGAFSQSVAEWFIRVYSNPGDTIFEPFCVCKDSIVLLNQQDKVRIQSIGSRVDGQQDLFGNQIYIDNAMSLDFDHSPDDRDGIVKSSNIENFYVKDLSDSDVYKVVTRNRRSINASGYHRFLIKNKDKLVWEQLKNIKTGDMVAIYPSIIHLNNNVKEEMVILEEKDLIGNIPNGVSHEHVLTELKDLGFIPLTNRNKKLYILSRLVGFLMTDGNLNENTSKDGYTRTYIELTSGEPESLVDFISDVRLLGFKTDTSPKKPRDKKKGGIDRGYCTNTTISCRSLYVLLKSLGVPLGKKTEQTFKIPDWINHCSPRVKQEFLGGLMGGDGEVPVFSYKILKTGEKSPVLSGGGFVQSKIKNLENHLSDYMSSIVSLLREFNVECAKGHKIEYDTREDGNISVTYHINFSSGHLNVLNFLRYIGYRYDCQKSRDTIKLYEYLISKENRIGIDTRLTYQPFYNYWKWEKIYSQEDVIFDEILAIKKIEYKDKLYDLSIKNTHNYIVNGFVTHNSGRGTTAMQALYTGRNMICNDLSPYSNILCHSVMFPPYMKDVLNYLKAIEDYMRSENCNVPTNYAGKGSDDDVAKLYHERTFSDIIKLRNLLNSRSMLLGRGYDNLHPLKWLNIEDNIQKQREYGHEIIMFLRMVMSQLMLHSSSEMSFNGIKTRGTDNTYIKGLLRYYESIKETPKHVNIFDNMRYFIEKMKLDELGVRDKFIKLNRKLISCDARKIDLPDKCADVVVTSPPYYANLNYGMANWLRIWSIGGVGDILIGNHINTEKLEKFNNSEIYGKTYDRITDKAGGTVDNPMSYSNFTGWYLKELYRILKDDAVAIIIVGDYGNKRKIEAWRVVSDRAEIFGFKPQMIIMDELNKQTKSSTQFQMKHEGGKNDYDVCVVLFKGKYQTKNNPEDVDFRWGAKFADGKQLGIDAAWG